MGFKGIRSQELGSADDAARQDVAVMEAEDVDGLGLTPVDKRKLLRIIADAKVRGRTSAESS